jgi:hypothetical protein
MSTGYEGSVRYVHGTRDNVSRIFLVELPATGVEPELLRRAINQAEGLCCVPMDGWVFTVTSGLPVQLLVRLDGDRFQGTDMAYAEIHATILKLSEPALNDLLHAHGCGVSLTMDGHRYPDGSGEPDDGSDDLAQPCKQVQVTV